MEPRFAHKLTRDAEQFTIAENRRSALANNEFLEVAFRSRHAGQSRTEYPRRPNRAAACSTIHPRALVRPRARTCAYGRPASRSTFANANGSRILASTSGPLPHSGRSAAMAPMTSG